jgi:hypothetical protein
MALSLEEKKEIQKALTDALVDLVQTQSKRKGAGTGKKEADIADKINKVLAKNHKETIKIFDKLVDGMKKQNIITEETNVVLDEAKKLSEEANKLNEAAKKLAKSQKENATKANKILDKLGKGGAQKGLTGFLKSNNTILGRTLTSLRAIRKEGTLKGITRRGKEGLQKGVEVLKNPLTHTRLAILGLSSTLGTTGTALGLALHEGVGAIQTWNKEIENDRAKFIEGLEKAGLSGDEAQSVFKELIGKDSADREKFLTDVFDAKVAKNLGKLLESTEAGVEAAKVAEEGAERRHKDELDRESKVEKKEGGGLFKSIIGLAFLKKFSAFGTKISGLVKPLAKLLPIVARFAGILGLIVTVGTTVFKLTSKLDEAFKIGDRLVSFITKIFDTLKGSRLGKLFNLGATKGEKKESERVQSELLALTGQSARAGDIDTVKAIQREIARISESGQVTPEARLLLTRSKLESTRPSEEESSLDKFKKRKSGERVEELLKASSENILNKKTTAEGVTIPTQINLPGERRIDSIPNNVDNLNLALYNSGILK